MNPITNTVELDPEKTLTFHCEDVMSGCAWQVSGDNEQDMMLTIEQHGHEKHNLTTLDDETRNKLRSAIRGLAAEKVPA
jgi:predicted small metal-binding protein